MQLKQESGLANLSRISLGREADFSHKHLGAGNKAMVEIFCPHGQHSHLIPEKGFAALLSLTQVRLCHSHGSEALESLTPPGLCQLTHSLRTLSAQGFLCSSQHSFQIGHKGCVEKWTRGSILPSQENKAPASLVAHI